MMYAVDTYAACDWGNSPDNETGYVFEVMGYALEYAAQQCNRAYSALPFLTMVAETLGHDEMCEELEHIAIGGHIYGWGDDNPDEPWMWTYAVEGSDLMAYWAGDGYGRTHYWTMP